MANQNAEQHLREMCEEARKMPTGRVSRPGKEVADGEHGGQKRMSDAGPAQEESLKRARSMPDAGTLVLQPSQRTARSFGRFAAETLADDIPDGVTGLREAAALSTHAAYVMHIAACAEEKLLAEKEADASIIRAQSSRVGELEDQLREAVGERSELKRQIASLNQMRPLMRKCREECQEAKLSLAALTQQLELSRAEVAQLKAEEAERKKAELLREGALERERELQEVATQQRQARAKGELLRAKKEAYTEGLEASFRIFNHYDCLDLEKYEEGYQDPEMRASAPLELYARQWAHLEGGADAEDSVRHMVNVVPFRTSWTEAGPSRTQKSPSR